MTTLAVIGVGRLVSMKNWWFSGSMLIYQRVPVVKGGSEETLYIFINQSMGKIWDIYGWFDLSADSNQGQPPAHCTLANLNPMALHSSDGFKNVPLSLLLITWIPQSRRKFLEKILAKSQIQVYLDTISESWETYREKKRTNWRWFVLSLLLTHYNH